MSAKPDDMQKLIFNRYTFKIRTSLIYSRDFLDEF